MRVSALFVMLLAGCALVPVAKADTYQFTFTSTLNPSQGNFNFDLPSSPTPAYVDPMVPYADTAVTSITAGGETFLSSTHWTTNGFSFDSGDYVLSGATLFTGPISGFAFKLGSFALTEFYPGEDFGTLVITDANAPEPSSWLLVATGMAGIGARLRTRRV